MFDRPAAIAARVKAPLAAAAAVLAVWLLAQALLWRSGAYWLLAEPDSNAGAVTHALLTLEAARHEARRTVLVFGDSRVGEGISGPRAAGMGDIDFINVAVPGSTPRTWYYLLREIERRGIRYDAVAIGMLYESTDRIPSREWPLDPLHQVALVGWRDLFDYDDARTILLPELVAQQDTRDLLAHPLRRWKNLRRRDAYVRDTIAYGGRAERMPEHASIETAAPIPADLARENAAYLAQWVGRIADLSQAPVIVFPLPRGPYAQALPPRVQPAWPGVSMLPADTFAGLEAPQYFFDGLHVNAAGRERMSLTLGAAVRERLAAQALARPDDEAR